MKDGMINRGRGILLSAALHVALALPSEGTNENSVYL